MQNGTKKRWLVVLPEQLRDWVRETAESAELRGSDIISEALERAKDDPSFARGLKTAQVKKKLQEINDKRTQLEEEARELKKVLGGGERTRETVNA